MYTPQTTRSAKKMDFCFFLGLIWWNSKSFHITRTIYHIKLADLLKWPTDPSLYIWHNIYIKDQKKWAEIRISGLFMNENFRISFETNLLELTCKSKRIKGKPTHRIVGNYFRKNLTKLSLANWFSTTFCIFFLLIFGHSFVSYQLQLASFHNRL